MSELTKIGWLGLEERWFQHNNTLPHFDLTSSKRDTAVNYGAIAQTHEEMMNKAKSSEFRKEWNLAGS